MRADRPLPERIVAAGSLPSRQPLHPGITEALIEALVRDFYEQVARDPELGPIFRRAIDDWEAHLLTLMDFWSSVTLRSGRFHGHPMQKHQAVLGIKPDHFARWLDLFRESAARIAPAEIAAIFVERAERIGETLRLGVQRMEDR